MKIQISIVLVFIAVCFACGDETKTIEETNDAGVVIKRYVINEENQKKEGIYMEYDEEGKLIEEATYVADILEGERKIYYSNGQIQYLERYSNGQYEGKYQAFHENGKLALEGQYENNAMTGEWLGYYDNGQMKERVRFEGGNENGPFMEWHPNGKEKAKGKYLDGDQEHGELLLFDEDGVLNRKMDCVRGRCTTTWKKEDSE